MGDRRRRRARDVESDAESENSQEYQNSGSESGSDDGDASPPNYEDVVELESDTKEQVLGNPVSLPGRKPRNEFSAKKDASFVPRSERFFLHDNRDDDTGGGKKGFGSARGPKRGGGRKQDDDFDWKHDKYEELIASEPARSSTRPARQEAQRNTREPRAERSTPNRATESSYAGASSTPSAGRNVTAAPGSASQSAQSNSRSTPGARTADGRTPSKAPADARSGGASGRPTPGSDRKPSGREVHVETPNRGPPAQYQTPGSVPSGSKGRGDNRSKQQTPQSIDAARHASRTVTSAGKGDPSHSGRPSAGVGARLGLPSGATVHVTAPTANTAVAKQSTPMKAPPGLDPSARVFQPTDDPRTGSSQSPPPVSASGSKSERQWKYGADPASYSYSTDSAGVHHRSPVVHASVPVSGAAVPVQQTVTFRMSSAVPPTAASAAAPVPPVVIPPSQQQVSFKEHSPHVQYPDPSTVAPMAAVPPHVPLDYRSARPRNGPPASENVDMYAHMAMQHGNMGMYRQPNVIPGSYNMPMASMGMPVYDPQMVYLHHDPAVMQMAHYGDGTMWYNVPQGMQPGMPQGIPMPGGPSQGGADGTGGTVYYPLPSAPPASE